MSLYNSATSFQNVKNVNKHAILDLIRFTPGGISRVEIARRMALSRAAMKTGGWGRGLGNHQQFDLVIAHILCSSKKVMWERLDG